MGISGLLPLLKSIQRPTDLKKYAGQTIAVDAYGWLHRGAISCAVELAQGRPTRRYVDSVMNRVRMVQHCGVTPYLVFDGDFLPSKAGTEATRAKRREESRKAGLELLNAGKSKQAYIEFQKAIDITPEMARNVIEELKKLGLPYIVAPYEADPQMVYLEREGLVSGILSEDSDLLVFGAKRLLTKLDMQGNCIEINRREFCAVREISLTDWTDVEFRHMAILSGCDYLEGVGHIGLKTAYRMIRKHKTIEKVVRMLQFEGKYKVSENYLAAFHQAELTFLHQRVFCPVKQQLILLSQPTNGVDVEEMRFIGNKMDHNTARGVALGELNPMTKEPIILPLSPGKKRRASSAAGTNGSVFRPAFPNTPNRQSPFGKPISEYFDKRRESASRIPLGAMDPNCFSIDRQQVAVLTQNGLTPRVFPLPRPYVDGGRTSIPSQPASASRSMRAVSSNSQLRRRKSEPVSNLLQLGTPPGSSHSHSLNRRHTSTMMPPSSRPVSLSQSTLRSTPLTAARPQKKARLTQDILDLPNTFKPLERSKYFSTSAATPSSAPTKHSIDFPDTLLMSDDSIEEAMLSLPDMDEWDISLSSKSATSSMRVFEDTSAVEASDYIPDSDGIEVPESPVVNMKRHSTATASTKGKAQSTPASQLSLGRFSYQGAANVVNGIPTPESSFVGSQESSATKSNSRDTPTSPAPDGQVEKRTKKPRMSLGELVEATSAPRPESERPRKKVTKTRRSMEASAATNPSFVPLPPADPKEVEALSRVQGSEDQIVPDSDAEDDDDELDVSEHTSNGHSASSTRFDLTRFLCP